MAQPKRRTSSSKQRMRRRSHKVSMPAAVECTTCGSPVLPHRVCHSCGSYNSQAVVSIKTDS